MLFSEVSRGPGSFGNVRRACDARQGGSSHGELELVKAVERGERRSGRIGIWVVGEDGGEAKIAALGVRVRRWISFHGIALNVAPKLDHFSGIVPCGLAGYPVTSLSRLGIDVTMAEVDRILARTFAETFAV